MRPSIPRVPLVSNEEYRRLSLDVLGVPAGPDEEVLNVVHLYGWNPALMRAQQAYQLHLGARSTLSARDREVVIFRIGWLCRAEYEVSQHSTRGGLTAENLARIGRGPESPGLSDCRGGRVRRDPHRERSAAHSSRLAD